jgi:hypothetical protein
MHGAPLVSLTLSRLRRGETAGFKLRRLAKPTRLFALHFLKFNVGIGVATSTAVSVGAMGRLVTREEKQL